MTGALVLLGLLAAAFVVSWVAHMVGDARDRAAREAALRRRAESLGKHSAELVRLHGLPPDEKAAEVDKLEARKRGQP